MTKHPLTITRARENNLKNISLRIEHDTFTTVTGLSGSGKSSLAFETVYAEGQRRYVETFSPYTRQFLDKVKKPDVDHIENVRPAIAIQQRTRVHNSRSTVGTLTNINDYLAVLWSNLATATCPTCGTQMERWPAHRVAHFLATLVKEDENFDHLLITAPFTCATGALLPELERLSLLGFSRLFLQKQASIIKVEELLQGQNIEDLFADSETTSILLSRAKGTRTPIRTLQEAIEQAYAVNDAHVCEVFIQRTGGSNYEALRFSDKVGCPQCGETSHLLPRPRPQLFSFNHPVGACPICRGFGKTLAVDLARIIPDPQLSLAGGAIQCWSGPKAQTERRDLKRFCEEKDIPYSSTAWADLTAEQQHLILTTKTKKFWGVIPWFDWLESKKYKMHVRIFLAKYRTQKTCEQCDGKRLIAAARAYQIDEQSITDMWQLPIGSLASWLSDLQKKLGEDGDLPRQLNDVFSSLLTRLRYLEDLGLTYLTLDRQARSLSGGETQRVNLATALGSDLVSTHFVLDEPSVGLHPHDTERLIKSVRALTKRGNSVLAVEHDIDFIEASDAIIEIGPGSGHKGGTIVYNGSLENWQQFDPRKGRPEDEKRRTGPITDLLSIQVDSVRNLKDFAVKIPLYHVVCITGVSGSGKSTLITEVIQKGWDARENEATEGFEISGLERVRQLLVVDQSPLAKSPRANVATYTKIWEIIRTLLAGTEEARAHGLTKSSFSFNVDGGRCSSCKGAGFVREDMQFLSDLYIPCDTCLGKRFQPLVLDVKVRGKNVSELLNLPIAECVEIFADIPKISESAQLLDKLGLGHLTLGHPLSELSGGEAQRLKLVPFIQERSNERSLLIFDEPTTGLHLYDVYRLIDVLRFLRDEGHSVFCVEHNLALIDAADWIVDLGPEGGEKGGTLMASCSRKDFIDHKDSHTARYLKAYTHATTRRKESSAEVKTNTKRLTGRSDDLAKAITICGARTHNLKGIDISIPLGEFVALTGVSGSGKSSIAKDILYAEGQRRYLDCLSPYARQFVQDLPKPDIDSITNILPTICVYQHTFQPSALSTVGTMSEVYNFLRLLFAKIGQQYCPDHPTEIIGNSSAEEIADNISRYTSRLRLLAPVIKQKKGIHRPVIERALSLELNEIRVDGILRKPGAFPEGLEKQRVHTIEYVIAHFDPQQVNKEIIAECVAQGLALGGGELVVLSPHSEEIVSTSRTCRHCQKGFFKPDPEDLSFNSRRGRCPTCHGTGVKGKKICPACEGSRLQPVGRNIRLDGRTIHELSLLTAPELLKLFESLSLSSRHSFIAEPVLREVRAKLTTLIELGLEYIPLNRDCTALSGGELQRLRLASALGSPLTGVLYIFDEPSSGLHPLENRKVLKKLREITDKGNSVIMIEHDAESILATDSTIDVGPGGGRDGGRIVFTGPTHELLNQQTSPTAQAILSSRTALREVRDSASFLTIEGGEIHTVHISRLEIPLHTLTAVIGVSGSGKSSLVRGIIAKTLETGRSKTTWSSRSTGARISSDVAIERVIEIDQKPIGKNARSTPASYLKIFDHLRKLFAATLEAKSRGWDASYFSYNTGKGRCPACNGLGTIRLEMNFLADARIICEQCSGDRYSEEAQSIRFSGLGMSDILKLTFTEARGLFTHHRAIHHSIHLTCDLGLGYLTLGQDSSTLSGGESQRLKLVSELARRGSGHTLYILDEPTTGLHKADVSLLLNTLSSLVDKGNSVLLIEHDEDVIRSADYLIEMGPGPGEQGGQVVFQGTPKQIVGTSTAWGTLLHSREGGIQNAANS
jgi:excinuclease ABC subunit A